MTLTIPVLSSYIRASDNSLVYSQLEQPSQVREKSNMGGVEIQYGPSIWQISFAQVVSECRWSLLGIVIP